MNNDTWTDRLEDKGSKLEATSSRHAGQKWQRNFQKYKFQVPNKHFFAYRGATKYMLHTHTKGMSHAQHRTRGTVDTCKTFATCPPIGKGQAPSFVPNREGQTLEAPGT